MHQVVQRGPTHTEQFGSLGNGAIGTRQRCQHGTLLSRLADHAAVAVQSTSPLFARRSYWCIMQTLAAAG